MMLRVLVAATLAARAAAAAAPALPPSQVRLTIGDTPDALAVSWVTSNVSTPGGYQPCVQWGPPAPAPPPLPHAACGNSSSYTAFAVRSPALHVARLTGLQADTVYAYTVGDARYGRSAPVTFRTPPAPAAVPPPAQAWTVAVTGDMGIVDSVETMATIGRMVDSGAVRMHFHAGDSGYADNRQDADAGTHTEDVLNTFYSAMSDAYAAKVVGAFAIGNHEMQLGDVGTCGGSGKNGTCRGLAYMERVARSLPTASSAGSPYYYAATAGPVRWISLSFESPWAAGSPQHTWAAAQIASVDRAVTPWVVVVVHRPLYSSNNLTWPDAEDMRLAYESLFVGAAGGAAGGAPAVDVVLGAHVHIYERAWQVAANGTYVRQDYAGMTTPLHVISGSAGCIEGSTPFIGTPPAWSAVRFGESTAFGFVTLAFHNSTHARHAFIDAHTGEELDSAWIVRQSAAPPSAAAAAAAAATSAGSSSSGSSSSRSSSAPLPLLAAPPPPPACRSVLSWPYAAGSIWNTPLGADAQLVPANLFPAAAPSAGVMSDDDYFIVTTAADPLTAWYSQGFWNSTPHCDLFPWSRLVGNLHWPAAMTITAGGNNAAAILQPDGDSLVLTQPIYKCAADAPILSLFDAAHGTGSIRGDGTWGGHGGSALNAIGGSLRVGEVLPGGAPPRHVLKLQLWARDYYYGAAAGANWSTCYTWPALVCDGYFDSGPDAYGGKNPLLRPGSLLALPAAALPALNATLRTEPARQIAWTLANYGGYLCDDTYADRATFNTEHGFSDQFVATWGLGPFEARSGPWFEDVVTLFRALAIVASNSPSAPGGGGAPLQPPPPPMC